MGKLYQELDGRLIEFIRRQHVFFVATAPTQRYSHVNVSPKGLDSFRILAPRTVAYQDLVGSGAETIAHLRQNGRITIMFCAFQGPPLILRLYGGGEVLEPDHPDFGAIGANFDARPGMRTIIRVGLTRIADSCGFGVPIYEHVRDRDQLQRWSDNKGPDGLAEFKKEKNAVSIDGLPALQMTG
jgi:hypothetical protein